MQRVKLLVLAVMSVFALGAAMSATAFARVEALNANNLPTSVRFTGASEKVTALGVLGKKTLVRCAKTDTEGELEATGKLGPFHLDFLKCRVFEGNTNLGPCTGLGEATETILALGMVHLATNSTLTIGYVNFLTDHLHFTCTVLIQKLVLVLGEYICKITPINVLTATATIKCERGAEDGDPAVTTYENDLGQEATLTNPLKAGETEGAEEMASEEGEGEVTLTPEAKIDV